MRIDLAVCVWRTPLPRVGQSIPLATIDEAGFRPLGFLKRLMLAPVRTAEDDKIFFQKNCFIECRNLIFNEHTVIPPNPAHSGPFEAMYRTMDRVVPGRTFLIGATLTGDPRGMCGTSIALFVGPDGLLRKLMFQVIGNRDIADHDLRRFRGVCATAFGPPEMATEAAYAWQDGETRLIAARNGGDAMFEWFVI